MSKTTELVERLRELPRDTRKATVEIYDLCIEASYEIEELTDRCARYAEEIAVLQEREKWVPVTERLPESAGDYLCWVKYYNMSTGNMEKEQRVGYFTPWGNVWGSDAVRGARATVLAWMPLPDGPEVE